jgi:hypothetical protein
MSAKYEETQILLLPAYPIDEKWAAEQDELVNSIKGHDGHGHGHSCSRSQGQKRNAAVKAGIIALVGLLITLGGLVALAMCCPDVHSLLKRQSSGQTNNGNGNTFTNDKLWIIIICVVGMPRVLDVSDLC